MEGWAFSTAWGLEHAFFEDHNERIFLKELRTALMAILTAAKNDPTGSLKLWVDNTAVMYALRSQRSPNATANEWITKVMSSVPKTFLYKVLYVHTTRNPVDRFTRLCTLSWG